jgi:lipoprotein-releasing system permease protein
MGSGVARDLGVTVGDRVRLISPTGVKTAMGTASRQMAYEVVYIFTAGRYDIDKVRGSTCPLPRRKASSTAKALPTRSR